MNIFNVIQIVKGGVYRTFVKKRVGDTPQQDIDMLSVMCRQSDFVKACNGKYYWYYLTRDVEDLPVAEYLLNRNGIVPTFRLSRYKSVYCERQPLFRLRQSYLLRYPELYNFVKQIKASDVMAQKDENIQQQILNIRNQMRQK